MAWPFDRNELELEILAMAYHSATRARDRIAPGQKLKDVCNVTGLPKQKAMLVPEYKAVRGDTLALQLYYFPDRIARDLLGILAKDPKKWTAEECRRKSALEDRIQSLFVKWEQKGWLRREPPMIIDEKLDRPDTDAPCWAARITREGLTHAKKVIPNHQRFMAPREVSILWAMSPADRRAAPKWAQDEFIAEGGNLYTESGYAET